MLLKSLVNLYNISNLMFAPSEFYFCFTVFEKEKTEPLYILTFFMVSFGSHLVPVISAVASV